MLSRARPTHVAAALDQHHSFPIWSDSGSRLATVDLSDYASSDDNVGLTGQWLSQCTMHNSISDGIWCTENVEMHCPESEYSNSLDMRICRQCGRR